MTEIFEIKSDYIHDPTILSSKILLHAIVAWRTKHSETRMRHWILDIYVEGLSTPISFKYSSEHNVNKEAKRLETAIKEKDTLPNFFYGVSTETFEEIMEQFSLSPKIKFKLLE